MSHRTAGSRSQDGRYQGQIPHRSTHKSLLYSYHLIILDYAAGAKPVFQPSSPKQHYPRELRNNLATLSYSCLPWLAGGLQPHMDRASCCVCSTYNGGFPCTWAWLPALLSLCNTYPATAYCGEWLYSNTLRAKEVQPWSLWQPAAPIRYPNPDRLHTGCSRWAACLDHQSSACRAGRQNPCVSH